MGNAVRKPRKRAGNGKKRVKKKELKNEMVKIEEPVPEMPDSNSALDQVDKPINFTIHRSYGDLDQTKFGSLRDNLQILSDVKIYEKIRTKSSDNLSTNSLPRNWLRRTSSRTNEEENPWKRSGSGRSTRLSIRRQTTNHKFPAVSELRHKLDVFETHFSVYLTTTCSHPPHVERVCVATEGDVRISLKQYLNSPHLPEVLPCRPSPTGLISTIPAAFCQLLARLKSEGVKDGPRVEVIGREIVTCIAKEVASELGRIFEYQIIMIQEDNSVRLLAEHCCHCIVELLNSPGISLGLERNAALQAVLYVVPKSHENSTVLSVVLGENEVKWTLANVLKRCGIRAALNSDGKMTSENGVGLFLKDEKRSVDDIISDVERYGYRGQCLLWNYVRSHYYLDTREERFKIEVPFVPGDVHQSYSPIRTLVGHGTMKEYMECLKSQQIHQGISFKDFFRGKTSASIPVDARIIYRPTSTLLLNPDALRQANLDGLDLCRFVSTSADLSSASLRHVSFSQARLSLSNMRGALLNGSNLAYSDLRAAQLRPQHLQEVAGAEYALISDSELVDGRSTEPVRVEIALTRLDARLDELRTREILPSASVSSHTFSTPAPLSPTTLRQLKRKRKKVENRSGSTTPSEPAQRPQSMSPHTLPRTGPMSPKQKARSISAMQLVRKPSNGSSAHVHSSFRSLDKRCRSEYGDNRLSSGSRASSRRSCFLHNQSMEEDIQNVIENLKSVAFCEVLPRSEPNIIGRQSELEVILSLIDRHRIISITGSPLVGKSTVLLTIGHSFRRSEQILPVYVDVSGILSNLRLFEHISFAFGQKLRSLREISILTEWIQSTKKDILLIIDNLSILNIDYNNFSRLLEGLLEAENLRIIIGSNTYTFSGSVSNISYKLPCQEEGEVVELLSQVLNEVERGTLTLLACWTAYNPGVCLLAAKSVNLNQASLSAICDTIPISNEETSLECPEFEEATIRNVSAIFKCLSYSYQDIIRRMSVFSSWADIEAIEYVVGDKNVGNIRQLLDDLEKIGAIKKEDKRYLLSPLLRAICQQFDNDIFREQYYSYYTQIVVKLGRLFHTEHSSQALETTRLCMDNILHAIHHSYNIKALVSTYNDPLIIIFLDRALNEEDVVSVFEKMYQLSDGEAYAGYLSGLSYHYSNIDPQKAVRLGEASVRAFNTSFGNLALGKALWNDGKKEDGLKLVKLALDGFRTSLGLRHVLSVYSYECYACLLTDSKKFQMARHYFNLSDLCVNELLGTEHPLLLNGYDRRNSIWKESGLFSRAVQAAKAASKIAQTIYGRHPDSVVYLQRLIDALIRRGTLGDAIEPAGESLTILHRTLGVSKQTLEASKTLLELLVKTGYYGYSLEVGNYAAKLINQLTDVMQQKTEITQLLAHSKLQLEYQKQASQIVRMQTDTSSKGTLLSETPSPRSIHQTDV